MTDEGYKAAETIVAENELQVSNLAGDTKTLRVKYGWTWEALKKLIEQELDIPWGLQKLVQGDDVLQFEAFDLISELVEKSQLPADKLITVMRMNKAWFWVDASGKNPGEVYSDHANSYKGLRKILGWLEDTACDELGVGVIHVPEAETPQTSAALLKLLSGSEEHDPVIPEDEKSSTMLSPWNGIAELGAVDISDIWPPSQATKEFYGFNTPYPSAEEVTRVLVCADAEATEDEVTDLASKSLFFACLSGVSGALKRNEEMQEDSYFYEKHSAETFVFVCVNPTKETIAFCFQTTFWE